MNTYTAEYWIGKLQLIKHPEGGYYKETYRASETITLHDERRRNTSTAIYYLLSGNDKSHFHRISSDEIWVYHHGEPIEIVVLEKDGTISTKVLGKNLHEGEDLQIVIPANTWFGAKLKNSNGYSLVSCIVAPGFDFKDFVLADRGELVQQFPNCKAVIEKFTR